MHEPEIAQLDIELFGGCDYACQMCPQSTGREKDFLRSMPIETFKKVVDDAAQYGLKSVSLHGGGEVTLYRKLGEAIRYVKSKGLTCYTFTNGYGLTEKIAREMIEAGIDYIRVSVIGSTPDAYATWMSKPAFHRVQTNLLNYVRIAREYGDDPRLHLYHLITDLDREKEEIEEYRREWSDLLGCQTEIWRMHNWSGTFDAPYQRNAEQRRSCGRPFAPLLQVRAGGLNKHTGAVVACCFVLGRDSEAVLGHLDTQTIVEVLNGPEATELRAAHREGRFDDLTYCRNCDQLYDYPEALVWTNIPGRAYGQAKGIGFDLREIKERG